MLDGVVGGALNLSFVEPKVEGPKTIAPKGALLGESEYAFHQRYLGT
jgi:hypothetical protein